MKKLRRTYKQPRLKKEKCEICGFDNKKALHFHHIIPKCDPRSHENNSNLAIVCASCHNMIHAGDITIIGVYSSTGNNGRRLMYFHKGEKPPLEERYWLIKENPHVITLK